MVVRSSRLYKGFVGFYFLLNLRVPGLTVYGFEAWRGLRRVSGIFCWLIGCLGLGGLGFRVGLEFRVHCGGPPGSKFRGGMFRFRALR